MDYSVAINSLNKDIERGKQAERAVEALRFLAQREKDLHDAEAQRERAFADATKAQAEWAAKYEQEQAQHAAKLTAAEQIALQKQEAADKRLAETLAAAERAQSILSERKLALHEAEVAALERLNAIEARAKEEEAKYINAKDRLAGLKASL